MLDAAADDATIDASGLGDATEEPDAQTETDAASDARVRADAGADANGRCTADDPTPSPDTTDFELNSVPYNGAGFPLGVMAGDALPTRAMVWTRYDGARAVRLRVVEVNARGLALKIVHDADVALAAGGFAHVDVTGLEASKRYRYAFFEKNGANLVGRSRIGKFRTAPTASSCSVIEFGGTSCNILGHAPWPNLQHAAAEELDFFIHCGDHIYADGGVDAETLAEYRAKYEQYWRGGGLNDLHASTGLFCTWDDHEVKNNWNAETIDNTAAGRAQLAAATRTFFEHRAFRRNSASPDRIYRSFKWGHTAEIFMLDCRGERRPSTRATANAQFISPAQLSWLKAGLRNSTAVFKFVVTSKPITGRVAMDLTRDDYWEGFPAQRAELLDFIVDNRLDGVWFLSGDVHYGCICKVERTGRFSALREVYMGPSGSGDDGVVDCSPANPQDLARIDRKNYTKFRADPIAKTLEISFIGDANNVLCRKVFPA